jgi:hypothetical protein
VAVQHIASSPTSVVCFTRRRVLSRSYAVRSLAGVGPSSTLAVFSDDARGRWTVVLLPAPPRDGEPRFSLWFTSESGEQRQYEVFGPAGGAWGDLDEAAWRALLECAEVVPSRH